MIAVDMTDRKSAARWLYDLPANTWSFHEPLLKASVAIIREAPTAPPLAHSTVRVIGLIVDALMIGDTEMLAGYERAMRRARKRRWCALADEAEKARCVADVTEDAGPNVVDLLAWLRRRLAAEVSS